MPESTGKTQSTGRIMLYGIVAVLVLALVYYLISSPNSESFTSNEQEVKVPPIYDRLTGSVVTGSEFLGVPDEVAPAWGTSFGEVDKLQDGGNGMFGLNYAMCSKSCCSPQYPPQGFELDKDVVVDELKDNFVPSQYVCNNAWQDSGCVCMTKKENGFLSSRGGNCQRD